MIDVNLSIEGYNRLYLYYLQGEDECEEIHVKIKDNKIIFVEDYDSNVVIASIDLDTSEGKILSHYTECTLRIFANEDGEIFIYESCMNPNDQYLGHCYNCFVDYAQSSYKCKKGIHEKIKNMNKTINDLRFVDPIPNRNHRFVEDIERYGNIVEGLENDFSHISDDDTKMICETAHLLQSQLEALYDKWNYGKFNRWDYDYEDETE